MDNILTKLLEKKRDLFSLFLWKSRLLAINMVENQVDQLLEDRKTIIKDLQLTDESIQKLELRYGVSSKGRNRGLETEIGTLVRSIQMHDQESLKRMEAGMKEIQQERASLNRERRISGYIRAGGYASAS